MNWWDDIKTGIKYKWDAASGWVVDNAEDIGHGVLDVGGFVPGAGEAIDLGHAVWYVVEEDYLNAGFCLLSLIPLVGDVIGKGGKYAAKLSPEAARKILQLLRKIDIPAFLSKFKGHPKLGPHIEKIEKALKEWMDDLEKKFCDKPAGKAIEPCPLPDGTASELVPGGGLAAHEAAGGHALSRHVGLSDNDLLARLKSEPGISGASTFTNREVAEKAIGDTLGANANQIQTWLGGSGGKLVLNGSSVDSIGRYVPQGSTVVQDVSGLRVILVRDPSLSTGYRIQTAFPKP